MCEKFKLSYFWNYCIDCNQILQSYKEREVPFVVVQICPKQIQDGGRPPSWKIEKSWYFCNSLTDFDEISFADTYCLFGHYRAKTFKLLKCKMAYGPDFEPYQIVP